MENEYKTGGYIYVKKQAFDFWKTYIEFLTKGMIDVPMPNPAIEFLADVKAGKYDEISDEEYDELLNSTAERYNTRETIRESSPAINPVFSRVCGEF